MFQTKLTYGMICYVGLPPVKPLVCFSFKLS